MTISGSDEDTQIAACRILRTTTRRGTRHTMLELHGEIDLSALSTLRAALGRCLDQRPTNLVVDVAAVRFCDCAGVRELNAAARRARADGGGFRLLGADASMRRVCELAGARDVLADCASADAADLARTPRRMTTPSGKAASGRQ